MKTGFSTLALLMLVGATCAHADSYPHRKPGLWELTMSSPDSKAPPVTSRMCIDPATEASLMSGAGGACSTVCSTCDVKFTGSSGTVDTVCKFGGNTQTTHSQITFTGDTGYRSEVLAKFEKPIGGKTERRSLHEAKWVGTCPADMKPGDVVLPTGTKMHIDPSK
jgi:hypothetical protein